MTPREPWHIGRFNLFDDYRSWHAATGCSTCWADHQARPVPSPRCRGVRPRILGCAGCVDGGAALDPIELIEQDPAFLEQSVLDVSPASAISAAIPEPSMLYVLIVV